MKPNRYIKAMEIGLEHERTGITYIELIERLQNELDYKFDFESEYTFLNWFIECFDFEQSNKKLESLKVFMDWHLFTKNKMEYHTEVSQRTTDLRPDYHNIYSQKFFLKGDAAKQYLDYAEYKAARKSSFWATILASISILIATVSFWFTYQASEDSPQPPYDVKVIEDSARSKELKEVKERLYKAEMTLEAYESGLDSVSGSGS